MQSNGFWVVSRWIGRAARFSGVAAATWACSGDDQRESVPPPSETGYFDTTRRIEILVELAPADWAVLREQGRSVSALFDLADAFEYTYFDASVTIDGQRYEQVQVRKKGFLGSLSSVRPSLKIDLDRTVIGQNHDGLRGVTLNNDRQDPSHTHQCQAYRLFARAGLPASRCNLAHVTVNGEDLGTYSNVEPITKAFLARHFSDNDGNLYEGQAADFVTGSVERLQLKTNEEKNDRSDVLALTRALEAEDDQFLEALGAELDLDHFRDFWAMETLVGHWDGYSGNTNNYYLYRDPERGRFVFLPWGVDSAFEGINPFDPVNRDITVYAAGRIANRLYAIPEERERYRERLGELNDTLWDEAALLAEVQTVEALAKDAAPAALAAQRTHIETHSGAVREALTLPAKDWQDRSGLLTSPCLGMSSEVVGSFDTSFGNLDSPLPGTHQLNLNLDGAKVQLSWLAGAGATPNDNGNSRIRYVGLLPEGRILVAEFAMPSVRFSPGRRLFHGLETGGTLISIDGAGVTLIGIIGDGAIDLTRASPTSGAAVVGTLEGRIAQFACASL